MAITFTPSLGESLSIPVSTWDIHTGGFVQIKFRTIVSAEESRRLGLGDNGDGKDGSKVQVWSDFPSSSSEREGEWSETNFEIDSDSQDGESVALSCVFNVPFHPLYSATAVKLKEFSFTYRILHRDSETSWVQWLGSYGQNGVVRIYFEDSQFQSPSGYPLVLGEGWIPTFSGYGSSRSIVYHILNCTSESPRHALTVKHEERWSQVSAIGKDGYSISSSFSTEQGHGVSMLFLVPRYTTTEPTTFSLIRPKIRAFAIAADLNSTVSLSLESGEIEITALSSEAETKSSVILQAFTSESPEDVDPIWDTLVRHSPNFTRNGLRLASLDDGNRIVIATSSPKTFPLELTLIPLTGQRGEGEGDVELAWLSKELGLSSLFGATEAQALASGTFAETEPIPQSIGIITLTDSKVQSRITMLKPVTLSPFTPLSPGDKVSICILTPHQNIGLDQPPTPVFGTAGSGNKLGAGDEEALPTPPPSPQLQPIAHLRGSRGNESMASISDIGISSRVPTPDPSTRPLVGSLSVQTVRASSRLTIARKISLSPSPPSSRDSPAPSSSSRPSNGSKEVSKRPAGLVACLRHLFFATSFFLVFWVRRLLCGTGNRAPQKLGFGSGTARYHSPSSGSRYSTPDRERERERRADENTPLLPQAQDPATSLPPNADGTDAPEPEVVPITVTSASSPYASSTSSSFTRTFELLDTTAAPNHALVLRGMFDFHPNERVKFEIDGELVGIRDIKGIRGEADAWYVELDWRKNGRLTVTYFT